MHNNNLHKQRDGYTRMTAAALLTGTAFPHAQVAVTTKAFLEIARSVHRSSLRGIHSHL